MKFIWALKELIGTNLVPRLRGDCMKIMMHLQISQRAVTRNRTENCDFREEVVHDGSTPSVSFPSIYGGLCINLYDCFALHVLIGLSYIPRNVAQNLRRCIILVNSY